MDITLFCFSGTGNTLWAARELSAELEDAGHKVKLLEVDAGLIALIRENDADTMRTLALDGADMVGFACPIHGADWPPIMKRLLAALARVGHPWSRAFSLHTVGYINACGPLVAARYLKASGFRLIASTTLTIADNALAPGTRTRLIPAWKLRARLGASRGILGRLAAAITAGRGYYNAIGPWIIGGIIVRRLMARSIREQYRHWFVDAGRCVTCMACVRVCPAGAIRYEGGRFAFGSDCSNCFRCYSTCPQGAIGISGRLPDTSYGKRYPGIRGILGPLP